MGEKFRVEESQTIPEWVTAFHSYAERGWADFKPRPNVFVLYVNEQDRKRWASLVEVERIWLVYDY